MIQQPNVGSMLAQRSPNIEPTLGQGMVLTRGIKHIHTQKQY